ncbi:hypothetical protein HK102_013086, partial [Quaeritorhiza haematococci]
MILTQSRAGRIRLALRAFEMMKEDFEDRGEMVKPNIYATLMGGIVKADGLLLKSESDRGVGEEGEQGEVDKEKDSPGKTFLKTARQNEKNINALWAELLDLYPSFNPRIPHELDPAFNAILNFYMNRGNIDRAEALCAEMQRRWGKEGGFGVDTYNTLILGLVRNGRLDEGLRLYDEVFGQDRVADNRHGKRGREKRKSTKLKP